MAPIVRRPVEKPARRPPRRRPLGGGDLVNPAPDAPALRDVALHEAGHAVAAYWYRVAIRRVTIQPDRDAMGSLLHGIVLKPDVEWNTGDRNRMRGERLVLVGLAGPAATRHVLTVTGRLDQYEADQHASDNHYAIGILGRFEEPQAVLEPYLSYMKAGATAFVAGNWWLIETVADALIALTSLSGRDVRRVIGEAMDTLIRQRMSTWTPHAPARDEHPAGPLTPRGGGPRANTGRRGEA